MAWPRLISAIPAGLLFSIPFAVMILLTRLDFKPIVDEAAYHIKIVESFADAWPRIDVTDYRSASTPMSYILMTAFGELMGFEIRKLRLLSAIAAFLSVYIFYGICKRQRLPHPLLSSFALLFFPYFFFFGFTIYPAAIALFFGMWALWYYLPDNATPGQLLKGSTLAALAILCRQSLIVIPAGMLLHEGVKGIRRGLYTPKDRLLTRLFILATPILMFIPFVAMWGGFTPPMNRASQGGEWFLQLEPQNLNYILVVVGFYFLPSLLGSNSVQLLRSKKPVLLAGAVLVPMFFLFPIVFVEEPGHISYVGGLVIRGLDVLGRSLGSAVGFLATLSLWIAGLLIVLGQWADLPWRTEQSRLVTIAITFVMLMAVSPFVYERYYVLLIPLIILLVHRSFHSKKLLYVWVTVQGMIAAGFSYWQIALK